jgi:hypothetical protein
MDPFAVDLADLIWHCKCSKTTKVIEERDQSSMASENTMRSERVFAAMAHVPNRFLLTKLAATATRKLHRPHARIQETMDEVFLHVSQATSMGAAGEPENARPVGDARQREAAA